MTTNKTIKSKYQPKQTNVTWVDLSGETPIEKHFINGRWIAVSGGSKGGDSEIFDEYVDATDQQRNTALANVSNQTANSTTGKMGYKVLDPTKTFAEQVTAENTIYEIRDVFDLGGNEFTIPSDVKFNFNGGAIQNGVLNGKLNTIQPLKGSNIGLKYGNTVYTDGTANVNKFNILSSVTNKVTVVLEHDIYLNHSSFPNFVMNSISIDGNGNKIFNYGTTRCFRVNKDIELKNVSVVSNGSLIELFKIEDNNSVSNILIENCKFSGNVHIAVSYKLAEDTGTRYFESVTIKDCYFNDICYQAGGVRLFDFNDTNIKNVLLQNNEIKNHYGTFFSAGITNGSNCVTYIEDFSNSKGRNFIIKDNSFVNDIDFKPWITYSELFPAYNCFVLAEKGDCEYKNNHVENIISNNSDTATYDAYLSVENVVYENNYWKNNLNIHSSGQSYNEFCKSKGGGGDRIYRNNKFITIDLSSIFELEYSPHVKIIDFQSTPKKNLIIENNIFDIYNYYCSKATFNIVDNAVVKNNIINISTTNEIAGSNFIVLTANNSINVCNNSMTIGNIINKTTNQYLNPCLLYSKGTSTNIFCNNNALKNCTPIAFNAACANVYCDNNTISFDSNGAGDKLINEIFENTSIENTKLTLYATNNNITTYTKNPCKFSFVSNNKGSNRVVDTLDNTGIISKVIIKITNTVTGTSSLFEYNVKRENSTWTFLYLKSSNGVYTEEVYSTSLEHKSLTNYSIGSLRGYGIHYLTGSTDNLLYEVEIKHIDNFTYFENILSRGITAQRPANITIPNGFQFYDITLGKYICRNGTTWVNLDGTPLS